MMPKHKEQLVCIMSESDFVNNDITDLLFEITVNRNLTILKIFFIGNDCK